MTINTWFNAPSNIQQIDYPEYYGIFVSGICGIIVNTILLVAFVSESLYFVAAFSISAMFFWSCAIYFVRRGQYNNAVNIGVFEIMFHVGVIVLQIGTIYGGQLVLWAAVGYAAFSDRQNTKITRIVSYLCLLEIALIYTFVPEKTDIRPFTGKEDFIFLVLTLVTAIPLLLVLLATKYVQKRQHYELQYKATHDSLTNLYNRGFFDSLVSHHRQLLARGNDSFCICLADIDHFKTVNDTYGHNIGDEVLVELAQRMQTFTRKSDAVCRWGGEEFAIILRKCNLTDAKTIIQKLQSAINDKPCSSRALSVSMSFGLTQASKNECNDALFKRTDVLLFKAKALGRNQIVVQDLAEANA